MATELKERKKESWFRKLRYKYRLVFMNDETLEERFTFRLSRLNVFVALGTLTLVLIFLTTILIAFTSLKEYIPGYTNVGLQKQVYELHLKTDSIEAALVRKERFIQSIRDVISGKDLTTDIPMPKDTANRYSNIRIKKSVEDSLLRAELENQARFNLYRLDMPEPGFTPGGSIGDLSFFPPVKGVVTSTFSMADRHYGVDIVSRQDEAIKSVLEGTVVFSGWTLETGYVIAVQHQRNILSVYKHNSALLRKEGEFVRAGDPIAIIGTSGELSTGPHLHFELWNNGYPVDPKDYITF